MIEEAVKNETKINSLHGAVIPMAKLSGVNLELANLTHTNLLEARVKECNWIKNLETSGVIGAKEIASK